MRGSWHSMQNLLMMSYCMHRMAIVAGSVGMAICVVKQNKKVLKKRTLMAVKAV